MKSASENLILLKKFSDPNNIFHLGTSLRFRAPSLQEKIEDKDKENDKIAHCSFSNKRKNSEEFFNKSQYEIKSLKEIKLNSSKDMARSKNSLSNVSGESAIFNGSKKKNNATKIFNDLFDLYDKSAINKAMAKAQNPQERQQIIDKILSRREEIQNAEQIVKLSRSAPLIKRLIKKIKSSEQIDQSNMQNSKSKLDSLPEEGEDEPNSSLIQKNKQVNIKNSVKGFALSLMIKTKDHQKLQNQSQQKIIIDNEDGNDEDKQQRSKVRRQSSKLNVITKHNFLFKNSLSSQFEQGTEKPKQTQQNWNKVSENSKALQDLGRNENKRKATFLLKDFQKESLAAYFKSRQFNNQTEVNTFDNEIIKKEINSKIGSFNPQDKKRVSSFSKLISTQEIPRQALEIVEQDIATFILKLNKEENVASRNIQSAKSKNTDQQIRPASFYFSPTHSVKLVEGGVQRILQNQQNQQMNSQEHIHFHTQNSLQNITTNPSQAFSEKLNNNMKPFFSSDFQEDSFFNYLPAQPKIRSHFKLPSHKNITSNQHFINTLQQFNFSNVQSPRTKKQTSQSSHHILNSILTPQTSSSINPKSPLFSTHKKSELCVKINSDNPKKISSFIQLDQFMSPTKGKRPTNSTSLSLSPNQKIFQISSAAKPSAAEITQQKDNHNNSDLMHESKDNDSTSYASFTEIKLDKLYKQSNKFEGQISKERKEKQINSCRNLNACLSENTSKKRHFTFHSNFKTLKKSFK